MANNYDTTTKFKVDISELKSAMQEAKRSISLANSEFKAVSSSMDNWAKSSDGLKAKLTQLNSNLNSQKTVLNQYEKTLEEVKKEYGENSKEAQEWQTKLNNQQAVVNKTEKEIRNFEDSLNDVTEAEKIASKTGKDVSEVLDEMDREADETKDSMDKLTDGFTVMKGALANLIADGIRNAISALKDMASSVIEVGTGFSSSMSEVQAISGASAEELAILEETARKFGSTTVFSASESADALKYMALAGWSVEESTSALGGVLNLASASGMGLAQASDMVTDYLSAFSLEAKDSAYFADMLAYAQSNSNTSAEQLGEAFKNCAAVLNAGGQDVETTTSLLASMANQGFKGSEAGTALTAIMRDMTAKMKDGKIAIGETNVEVMDANGNYRDLTDILKDVEGATQGMGDAEKATALSSTFTADSIKGLNLILNDGVSNAEEFEEALRNSGGSAEEMSKIMNDNLAGDVKAFQSALEELSLKVYDALEPALRDIIAFVQELADEFNAWLADPKNKKAIDELGQKLTDFVTGTLTDIKGFIKWFIENKDSVVAGIVAIGAGLLAWNVVTIVQGLVGAIKAFKLANEGATIAQLALNLAMKANVIGIIITAITALVAAFIYLWNTSEDFRNFWISLWESIMSYLTPVIEAIVNFFTVTVPQALASAIQWFKDLGASVGEFVDSCVTFISQLPAQIAEWLTNTINNVVTWAGEMKDKAIETGKNFLESVIKFFSELPNKLAYQLGYAIGTIIKWGLEVYDFITVEIPKIIETIVKFFSELPAKLWTWLVNTYNKVVKWASDMKTKATETGKTFIETIINFVSQLPEKVWTWLKNTYNKAVTWANDMKDKATEAGKNFIDTVISFIKELPEKIWTWLKSTYDKAVTWTKDMKDKATEAGENFVKNVIDFIKNLPSKIATEFTNVINKASTFISDMKTKATEAGNGFVDNLVSAVTGLPDKFSEIGSNIVTGIWNGISGGWSWLKEQVSGLAGSLLQGAKDALKINSPSKAFRDQVGKWIPEGIAVGVEENAKTALNSVKNLALDMVGATTASLGTSSGITGGLTGGVVNNYTQIINSPKQLSRLDIYRQSKNLLGFSGGGY